MNPVNVELKSDNRIVYPFSYYISIFKIYTKYERSYNPKIWAAFLEYESIIKLVRFYNDPKI
jgi:hypothetical protein